MLTNEKAWNHAKKVKEQNTSSSSLPRVNFYFYESITEHLIDLGKFGQKVNQSVSENYLPKVYFAYKSFNDAISAIYTNRNISEVKLQENSGIAKLSTPFGDQIRKIWKESLQTIKLNNKGNIYQHWNINQDIKCDFPYFSDIFKDWKNSLEQLAFHYNLKVEDLFHSNNRFVINELEKLNDHYSFQWTNSEESTKEFPSALLKKFSNSLYHSLFLIFVIRIDIR